MKRLISLLLCFSFLLPCFLIVSFADGSEDLSKYIEQGKTEGAEQFVNIENYVENAGKPGVTDVVLLGIEKGKIANLNVDGANNNYLSFDFCIYNPELLTLNFTDDSCGKANISIDNREYNFPIVLSESSSYDMTNPDSMFIRFTVRTLDVDSSFGKELLFNNISLDFVDSEVPLNVGKSTVFNDFDSCVQYTDSYTDIAWFNDVSIAEILEIYPLQGEDTNTSVVFLYETGYGTGAYCLYLYVYNPEGYAPSRLSSINVFTSGGDFKDISVKYISGNRLAKYKISNPGYFYCSSDGNIRDYYITTLSYDEGNNSSEYKGQWHFSFSGEEIPENHKEKFVYEYYTDYGDDGIFFDEVYATGKYDLKVGDIFTFYFFYKEFYDLDIVNDCLTVIENGDGYVKARVNENYKLSYGIALDIYKLCAISDFPYFPEDIPESFDYVWTYTSITDGVEGEKISSSGGIYENALPIYQQNSTISLLSSLNSNDSSVKYIKVNMEESISFELFDTYYRIDSSATANNLYQTLQSVYFTLPNKYLEMNDLNFLNDRTVSAIEFEYNSAMITPAIYTANEDFYNELLPYIGKISELVNSSDYSLYTNPDLFHTGDSSASFYCDFLIGDSKFPISLAYSYVFHAQDKLDNLYYLFKGDEYGLFEEVITSEEFLNAIEEKGMFVEDLKHGHYILHDYDTFELKNIYEMSFDQMVDEFNIFNAFWFNLTGTTQTFEDGAEDIPAISTISGSQLISALKMDDASFSKNFYVALSDVPSVKLQMQNALDNNEAFVFLRYDVYDYYAADLHKNGGTVKDTFLFQGKYYDNFDIVAIALSNHFDTKAYSVSADSIDIAPAVTSPDPVDTDQILDPGNSDFYNPNNWNGEWWLEFQDWFKNVSLIISIILVIPVALIVVWLIKSVAGLFVNNDKKRR